MKKLSTIGALATAFFAPLISFADDIPKLTNPVGKIGSTNDLISLLIQIVQLIMSPIVVLYIIYAGYKIVTAGGDETKLTEGKHAFIWGAVGATIILGATIIQVVLKNTTDQLGIST